MRHVVLIAWAVLAGGVGCDADQKTAPPGSAAPTQKAATTAAAPGGDEIPCEADFEEEAEREITADGLEAELDKLEKEIASD